MNQDVAILTNNNELLADFKNNLQGTNVFSYKSLDSLRNNNYSMVAIDTDLFDDLKSFQFVLSKIRKKIHEIPVLLIMKTNNIDQIENDWFYDDFVLYPFRKNELNVRSSNLMLEINPQEEFLTIGELRIDTNEYAVYQNSEKLTLTYKEFELLRLFAENRGTVFSRKDLLNKIWGVEYIGGTRTVDVHIRRLRGKLGDEFNSLIETIRNVGYRCKE